MGMDRWKQEHRAYRPDRSPAEVTPENRALDVPDDLPIQPAPRQRRDAAPRRIQDAAMNTSAAAVRSARTATTREPKKT